MQERRRAVRVPWVTAVECEELESGARHQGAELRDISLSGVLVYGVPLRPEGTMLRLRFTLPSLQMVVAASVVHTAPDGGMGLSFLDLTPVHRVVIRELMKPETAESAPGASGPAELQGPETPAEAPETAALAEALTPPEQVGDAAAIPAPDAEVWPPPLPPLPPPAAFGAAAPLEAMAPPVRPEPAPADASAVADTLPVALPALEPAAPATLVEAAEPWPPPLPSLPDQAPAEPAIPPRPPAPEAASVPPTPRPVPHTASLPLAPEPSAASPSGSQAGGDEAERRPRVLVVDDHDRTRTMLRGMIEGRKKAFDVIEACDGEDCLRIVREQSPFDLIFLDVDMPRLDGFGTCRQLRALGVRSPIIFLTGRSEIGDFRAGREAGADTYIKKPIVLGTLRSMLGLFTSGSLQRR